MPEQETIYKTILHTLPDFFFEIDTDCCFAYVNNSSLVSGFSTEELISSHLSVIMHPDDFFELENLLKTLSTDTSAGKHLSREFRFRRKVNNHLEYFIATLCLYPLYKQNTYRGAIGILKNTDSVQEHDQAMVLAEKHYRALLANSGELILIITIDGTILFASESSIRIIGYHPFDLAGEDIRSYLSPDDIQHFFDSLTKKGKAGVLLRFTKKNGRVAHMNSRIQIVNDPDGNIVCAIVNSLNVGKTIRAERRLKRTENKYRCLFDSATFGILSIDRENGIIHSANKYSMDLFGISENEDPASLYTLFEHSEELDRFKSGLDTNKSLLNSEATLKRITGETIHVLLNAQMDTAGNVLMSIVDLTAFRTTETELLRLQKHDPLTGLPNRVYFGDYIQKKLAEGNIFALLCLGIDRFKQINDEYGHNAGDNVLKKLSDRIKNVYFSKDLVSRFESDRFMILISDLGNPHDGIDYDIIELLSRKTKEIFSLPFVVDTSEVRLQASVGICFYPFDGTESEILINRTELSMFMAKERGGNTFSYYDDRVNTDMLLRYQLEKELFEAHASREFMLYYQPLVNTEGQTVAYEALLRWKNRRGEFIPPSSFIPIAEKNSLIVEIGYFVFERACEDLAQIITENPNAKMNINISPVQFSQYDFIDNIRHIMHISTVPAVNIEIEITETALFDNMDIAVEKLHLFKKMGFSISIDDFGTGYSSLAKLKTFPLKSIKIDKSFVDDVIDNPASATLVCTMIDLAHNLGCEVIAEGVESKEQFLFLKEKGCDIFQGYYFSKPLPLEQILKDNS